MRATGHAVVVLGTALGANLIVAGGCSIDDSIVGGECAAGYAQCGAHCCVIDGSLADVTNDGTNDGTSQDAPLGDGYPGDGMLGDVYVSDAEGGSGGDGSGDGMTADGSLDGQGSSSGSDGALVDSSNQCPPPLVACNGKCVDTSSDDNNCGSCGNMCTAPDRCELGHCFHDIGHFVYIGSDYSVAPGVSTQQVLTRAINLAQQNTILSYEQYAQAAAVARVKGLFPAPAYTITSTTNPADVQNLSAASYGALILHDQTTVPAGKLATLGSNWATALTTYVTNGGVVILLDGGTGTGEMYQLANATLLPMTTAHAPLVFPTLVETFDPTDSVAPSANVYIVPQKSVSLTTSGQHMLASKLVYVSGLPAEGGMGEPVVIHESF
jgi:hypothetical protein